MGDKIIWTQKELEEEAKSSLSDFSPLKRITTPPFDKTTTTETSLVDGIISNIAIYLPPGSRDLVSVSILLGDTSLAREIYGENTYHSLFVAEVIKKGNILSVIVSNRDTKNPHSISVRVEVNQD